MCKDRRQIPPHIAHFGTLLDNTKFAEIHLGYSKSITWYIEQLEMKIKPMMAFCSWQLPKKSRIRNICQLRGMIIRKDGKSNIYKGDCFHKSITNELKKKNINIGLINPPYSQKDVVELEFVEHLLDILTIGGTGVVVVPMSCAINVFGYSIKNKSVSFIYITTFHQVCQIVVDCLLKVILCQCAP